MRILETQSKDDRTLSRRELLQYEYFVCVQGLSWFESLIQTSLSLSLKESNIKSIIHAIDRYA